MKIKDTITYVIAISWHRELKSKGTMIRADTEKKEEEESLEEHVHHDG
jgi:alkylated DNA nucleotide flippase Atl1